MMSATDRTRRALTAASLLVPLLTIAGSWLAWQGRLPATIATHWSGLGVADASAPTSGVLLFSLIGSSVALLAGLVLLAAPRLDSRTIRGAMFWLGMLSGIAVGVWLVPAWLTLRAGSAEDAVLGGWIIAVIACTLYGVVPYALMPRVPLAPNAPVTPLVLAETEVGAWSRTITAKVFVWATLILVVLAGAITLPLLTTGDLGSGLFGPVVMLVVIILLAAFTRLRVTVDWRGLRVVSALLRIPLKRIRPEHVRAVEAAELRASEWGGWGYRFAPGRSAIILRSGPGLVVTTATGRQFAVTIADPEIPAALLQAIAQRQTARSGPQARR